MSPSYRWYRLCVLLPLLCASPAPAQNPSAKKSDAPNKKESPATYEVKRAPLKIDVSLDGVFEASQLEPISVRLDAWKELVVLEAVEQGRPVKGGERLIRFDTEKIDRQIETGESSLDLAKLSVKLAEANLTVLEKNTPLSLVEAERRARQAKEDLKRYLEVEHELSRKSTDYSLKAAQFSLENQLEELHQLEKMYEADDLTEETEEIVLKRQRFYVEMSRFALELSKDRHQRMVELNLPRTKVRMEHSTAEAELDWQRARTTLPIELNHQRRALAQKKNELESQHRKLDKLRKDRQAMTVTAPIDGVVYYGQCVRGKWSGQADAEKKLRKFGHPTAGSVVMTVVVPGDVNLRVTIAEKHFGSLHSEKAARVVPTAYPLSTLSAKLVSISPIAVSSGKFDGLLSVDVAKTGPSLTAGMTGKATVTIYERSDAITVPATAVSKEGETSFVTVVTQSGREHRQVRTGHEADSRIEIVDGLKEGEKILANRKP
ncbi:MAG: HlyD family efflux transporter periplasmic adaptor subunit [Pirellulales bacterium]